MRMNVCCFKWLLALVYGVFPFSLPDLVKSPLPKPLGLPCLTLILTVLLLFTPSLHFTLLSFISIPFSTILLILTLYFHFLFLLSCPSCKLNCAECQTIARLLFSLVCSFNFINYKFFCFVLLQKSFID